MDDFKRTILSITNIDELKIQKNRIKDQVTNPSLRWDERMEMYKRVQFINGWIHTLNNERNPYQLYP